MSSFVQNITSFLSLGTVAADVLAVILVFILITPLKRRGWGKKIRDFFGTHAVLFSFLVALASVIGSLFYSEFAHFKPCELCWIQRGFLYTEAVIFFVALLARKDEYQRKYGALVRNLALGLSTVGGFVSAYHTYLQFGGNTLVPCSATGASCEFVYFVNYGYVTIPTMALTAFILIIVFMLCRTKNEAVG